jgi:hypothetical protein
MSWLQIRLFGLYLSSFSTNSYGYYSQMSQNLFSKGRIFASALIVRQAASQELSQSEQKETHKGKGLTRGPGPGEQIIISKLH